MGGKLNVGGLAPSSSFQRPCTLTARGRLDIFQRHLRLLRLCFTLAKLPAVVAAYDFCRSTLLGNAERVDSAENPSTLCTRQVSSFFHQVLVPRPIHSHFTQLEIRHSASGYVFTLVELASDSYKGRLNRAGIRPPGRCNALAPNEGR
jgi:hypothetical protein